MLYTAWGLSGYEGQDPGVLHFLVVEHHKLLCLLVVPLKSAEHVSVEQVIDTLDPSCVLVVLQGVLGAPLLILISHLLARSRLSQSVFGMGDDTLESVEDGLVDLADGDVLAIGGLDGDGPREVGGYEAHLGLVRLGGGQVYRLVGFGQDRGRGPEDLPDVGAILRLAEEGMDGVLGELLVCGHADQIRALLGRDRMDDRRTGKLRGRLLREGHHGE